MSLPLVKRTHVMIDDSFSDADILGIVAAFANCHLSEMSKHDSICRSTRNKQELDFSLHLQVPQALVDKGFQELLDKILKCRFTVNTELPTNADAVVQVLNYEEVYNLAKTSERSISQVVGILLGAEAAAVFDLSPAVLWLKPKDEVKEVCTVAGLPRVILDFMLPLGLVWETSLMFHTKEKLTYIDAITEIANMALVVGPPSFFTYAAACLGVPTIEIFNTREHMAVSSKWASPKYAAALVDEFDNLTLARLQTLWAYWQKPIASTLLPGEVG